ncbi:MAG: hypothetical protein GXO89_07535 [Chlorobi bacterium]|nr:hypothetical protein [Chlorobiota bacterium]
MKTINYIILLSLAMFFTSCKTKKEVVKTAPPKSSYETVSLPQIASQEKTLSPDEIEKIRAYAEEMGKLHCSVLALQEKYRSLPKDDIYKAYKSENEKLEEMKMLSEEKFVGSLEKAEFVKQYEYYKKGCK